MLNLCICLMSLELPVETKSECRDKDMHWRLRLVMDGGFIYTSHLKIINFSDSLSFMSLHDKSFSTALDNTLTSHLSLLLILVVIVASYAQPL